MVANRHGSTWCGLLAKDVLRGGMHADVGIDSLLGEFDQGV